MLPTFSFRTEKSSECSRHPAGAWGKIWWLAAAIVCVSRESVHAANLDGTERSESAYVITNAAQFRAVPPEIFLGPCAFRLNGVVTWGDTNRDLLVVQDETGAVAMSPAAGIRDLEVQVGQRVSLAGSGCSPGVVGFPNYPYRPSGSDVRPLFEAPGHWGEYYLTRMRGYLHPPVTGEYTFWIASDNSSELWLSSNEDPRKMKQIASIARYNWVAPREWSRFPSQRSESILLQGGQSYYIEADQEQATGDDHLAVAWQGPTEKQSVIPGVYLTPWVDNVASLSATNGILREYWLDFSLGSLATITGPRPFDSILNVEKLWVMSRDSATLPKPLSITLNQQLRPEERFNWVEAQGEVTFTGKDDRGGFLELSDDEAQIQVRVAESDPEVLRSFQNATVRVTGVCEGVYDAKGVLVPGLIWTTTDNNIAMVETAKANLASVGQSSKPTSTNNAQGVMGFYNLHGVVTFDDQVFGEDIMFVQDETAVVLVSLKERSFKNRFEVGRWVELGGGAKAGKNIPTLIPLSVMELGWRSMPVPATQPLKFPIPGNRDGRWTELEGVVHSANPNGTLTLSGVAGLLSVWIGKSTNDNLNRLVDAKVRLRGVLSLTLQDSPLLLVPSMSFVNVEKDSSGDPFAMPACLVSNVFAGDADLALAHRVKLTGTVTLNNGRVLFIQDGTAGVRVQPIEHGGWPPGQPVEAVGFPAVSESVHTLTQAMVRPIGGVHEIIPWKLDGGDGISFNRAGTLVQVNATLIGQHRKPGSQILELQEKQRLFEAELPAGEPQLPVFAPGSRLRLSGVCDFAQVPGSASSGAATESPSTGALKIWLRSPADVVLLSGPPWWSWKYTAVLVSVLLLVVAVSLLRIHLLRRRLERHLTLSRQILESQESERHRIAANLHDSLGQNLLVIKNQAHLAMQPAEESVLRQRLGEISNCAAEAIAEVREITYALRPYQLDRLGLTQTIRATVNRAAENSPILFASHTDDIDGVFDKESEIHVYRIVQEAVNNILKHSQASEAAVVVKKLASTVSLSIRDNGCGFDAIAAQHSDSDDVGHGLNGIKERVRILSGTFVIDSRPGHGTTLSIEIPILVFNHARS